MELSFSLAIDGYPFIIVELMTQPVTFFLHDDLVLDKISIVKSNEKHVKKIDDFNNETPYNNVEFPLNLELEFHSDIATKKEDESKEKNERKEKFKRKDEVKAKVEYKHKDDEERKFKKKGMMKEITKLMMTTKKSNIQCPREGSKNERNQPTKK